MIRSTQPRAGAQDLTCTFKYMSFGGTNEEWHMSLFQTESEYQCIVQRLVVAAIMAQWMVFVNRFEQ